MAVDNETLHVYADGAGPGDTPAMAVELIAYRGLITPDTGNTLHDRLAMLHDQLAGIAAQLDESFVIWDDLQTAIEWASALTDETQAVTP